MSHDRYYSLIKLELNKDINVSHNQISIYLDKIQKNEFIENDIQFKKAFNKDFYFYFSGGGSFLFLDRYLMLVKRSSQAKINSGKLSLFTGRSNDRSEWMNPELIIRELFEEVNFYKDGKPVNFTNDIFRDTVELRNKKNNNLCYSLPLNYIPLNNFYLEVFYKKKCSFSKNILCHLSTNNDINFLYFFNINENPCNFKFTSYDDEDKYKRKIYFLDLKDQNKLYKIKNKVMKIQNKKFEFTELGSFALNIIKTRNGETEIG